MITEAKMGSKELKTRDQIDSRYKWNIEAMMPDEGIIDGELEKIKRIIDKNL